MQRPRLLGGNRREQLLMPGIRDVAVEGAEQRPRQKSAFQLDDCDVDAVIVQLGDVGSLCIRPRGPPVLDAKSALRRAVGEHQPGCSEFRSHDCPRSDEIMVGACTVLELMVVNRRKRGNRREAGAGGRTSGSTG